MILLVNSNCWHSQWRRWIPHTYMTQDPLYDRRFLDNRQVPHLTTTTWTYERIIDPTRSRVERVRTGS